MTFKPLLAAILLATATIAAPAMAHNHKSKMKTEVSAAPSANIVETAVSVDRLSTLVATVQAADLAGALSADGPFTVFARPMMRLLRCQMAQWTRCSSPKTRRLCPKS